MAMATAVTETTETAETAVVDAAAPRRPHVPAGMPLAGWFVVAVVFVVEYYYWHRWSRMWDGDSLFYSIFALKYEGHSLPDAMHITGAYFDQQSVVAKMGPSLVGRPIHAPGWTLYFMVKPRFVYPMLAVPFIWLFGLKGIWGASLLCCVLFAYGFVRLATRLFGPSIALAVTVLYLLTSAFWHFQSGLLTEGPAVAEVVFILLNLPIKRTVTRKNHVWVAVLMSALTFTRQSTIIPVAAVVFAWMWTWRSGRRWRNEWATPAAICVGIAVVMQTLTSVLWPYNPLRNFAEVNHLGNAASASHHIGQIIGKLPGIAWHLLYLDLTHEFKYDNAMRLLWMLALLAALLRAGTIYGALFFGGLLAAAFLWFLDSTMSEFRYFLPMYPMLLLVVAELLRGLGAAVSAQELASPNTAGRTATAMLVRPRRPRS